MPPEGILLDLSNRHLTRLPAGLKRYGCVSLANSTLEGVVIDSLNATFDLRRITLVNVTIKDTILTGSDFRRATLRDVRFIRSGLLSAVFGRNVLDRVTYVDVTCPSGLRSGDNNDTCEGQM